MKDKALLIFSLICVLLQIIVIVVCYICWKKDCKEIGKENLAVSLEERLFAGFICFPFWIAPIVILAKY